MIDARERYSHLHRSGDAHHRRLPRCNRCLSAQEVRPHE